jgi:HPt (histidine-containing phosphotransfer) domain-containing protein
LKGSAYTFGAHQMGGICEELEERARAREIEDVEPLVIKLEEEFARLRQILEPQLPGATEKGD